jgi:hypothetical protein
LPQQEPQSTAQLWQSSVGAPAQSPSPHGSGQSPQSAGQLAHVSAAPHTPFPQSKPASVPGTTPESVPGPPPESVATPPPESAPVGGGSHVSVVGTQYSPGSQSEFTRQFSPTPPPAQRHPGAAATIAAVSAAARAAPTQPSLCMPAF